MKASTLIESEYINEQFMVTSYFLGGLLKWLPGTIPYIKNIGFGMIFKR